jgi:peptidyl-prolyl cis-trans isomerase B (cyclophilin B)
MLRMFSLIFLLTLFLIHPALADTPEAQNPKPVKISMKTDLGTLILELYPDKAPETVKNFLRYATAGFYEGTLFHRVIHGFMVQGGGFTEDMQQKPTLDPIPNEAANGLKNLKGTMAMARTNDPHSATSQFFINTVDNAFLDFKAATPQGFGYCVFGQVVEGMDVLSQIERVPTTFRRGHQNVPKDPVRILQVTQIP